MSICLRNCSVERTKRNNEANNIQIKVTTWEIKNTQFGEYAFQILQSLRFSDLLK